MDRLQIVWHFRNLALHSKIKIWQKEILQDSGALKESIISRNNGVNKVSIGTNLSYAPIHQFGGKTGRGGKSIIPARAYLPVVKEGEIPKDLKKSIKLAIKKHFN